jgi:hypothetical protein
MKRSPQQDDKTDSRPQHNSGDLIAFLGPKALRELRVLLRLAAPSARRPKLRVVTDSEDLDKAA